MLKTLRQKRFKICLGSPGNLILTTLMESHGMTGWEAMPTQLLLVPCVGEVQNDSSIAGAVCRHGAGWSSVAG